MPDKSYTIAELKDIVSPIAMRYGVERVFLFGSYARGEIGGDSDIDLRIDSGAIQDYFELSGFHQELETNLNSKVDLLTTRSLENKFLSSIVKEEVMLYEQTRH